MPLTLYLRPRHLARYRQVAQTLGLSVAAVYLAKSRVMVKLKEEIARLNAD